MDLEELKRRILSCSKCPLRGFAKQPVPGEGPVGAKVMFVGEAPGREEDEQGRPFVGRAGRLLRYSILKSVGLKEDEVYITNVVKCRPPNNRTPTLEEIQACGPYLLQEIRIVRPKVIVALGRVAAAFLLRRKSVTLSKLRGRVFSIFGIPIVVTRHPAAALRRPWLLDEIKEDVRKALELASGEFFFRSLRFKYTNSLSTRGTFLHTGSPLSKASGESSSTSM